MKGPGLAKTDSSSAKLHYTKRASLRLQLWAEGVTEPVRELARLIECDESSLRKAKAVGIGLPIPWWLEALIERRPDLALSYVESFLDDIERSMAAKRGEP